MISALSSAPWLLETCWPSQWCTATKSIDFLKCLCFHCLAAWSWLHERGKLWSFFCSLDFLFLRFGVKRFVSCDKNVCHHSVHSVSYWVNQVYTDMDRQARRRKSSSVSSPICPVAYADLFPVDQQKGPVCHRKKTNATKYCVYLLSREYEDISFPIPMQHNKVRLTQRAPYMVTSEYQSHKWSRSSEPLDSTRFHLRVQFLVPKLIFGQAAWMGGHTLTG